MNCEQANNLFDAYLDGALSPSLETELAAHRLHCDACRHELALMEVAGHVIRAGHDRDGELGEGFTDRLLACIEPTASITARKWNRRWWIGGSALAAAAVLLFAVTAWVIDPGTRVAGERHRNDAPLAAGEAVSAADPDLDQAADALVEQVGHTWNSRADSAQSLIEFGQMTLLQLLDRFGAAPSADSQAEFEPLPASFDELSPADENAGNIEDL